MYAINTYIDPSNHPNVGIYGIHGVSGLPALRICDSVTRLILARLPGPAVHRLSHAKHRAVFGGFFCTSKPGQPCRMVDGRKAMQVMWLAAATFGDEDFASF